MEPLELCEIRTVEVLFCSRKREVIKKMTAHCFLDFACHREQTDDLFSERWVITHQPSGRRAAGEFRSLERAAAAMVEIARLRNDWACIADEDAAGKLTAAVEGIAKKYDDHAEVGAGRKGAHLVMTLNGYGAA